MSTGRRGVAVALASFSLAALPPSTRAAEATREKQVLLPFADALFAGALAGAGLDETTPAEIIHPTTRARVIAAIRNQGGVLQDGKSSLVLQLTPFHLTMPRDALYLRIFEQRRNPLWRLYQDTAVTLTATPGKPGTVADQQRFFTIGSGISVELLGNRSVYSSRYASCIRTTSEAKDPEAVKERAAILELPPARPEPEKPKRRVGDAPPEETRPPIPQRQKGETNEQFADRLARWEALARDHDRHHRESDEEYGRELLAWEALVREHKEKEAERAAAVAKVVDGIEGRIRRCAETQAELTSALYVSAGGRWSVPSLAREPGDSPFVQREYLAGTYEVRTGEGISVSVQARWLGERSTPVAFERVVDGGASFAYEGSDLRWNLDATQTLSTPGAAPTRGTIAASLRARVTGDLAVLFGVRGEGKDVGRAFDVSTFTVSLAYEDKPILVHTYAPPRS